ncbi:MAG: SRPBCC domain-containing protein [Bacteroidetes bacterium]|nr:SRPBCC domain-containing protein [Bacteroidota bacterium]
MTRKQGRIAVVLEFPIKCSPSILFNYISSASGLQEWFAHKVVTKSRTDYVFTFDDGQELKATLLKNVNNKLTRFHFANTAEDEYIEMEILIDELTEDVALKVTEFCNEDEKREIEEVWHTQVETLKDVIGA